MLHAPLYPLLIAALLFLVRSPLVAGIAVSMVSGTLFAVFVYRLTAAIAGARAALVAGTLAALDPFMIGASIVPLSEALYLALTLAGLDALVRALQLQRVRGFALAGLCFGFAYLTREEGLAYVVIAALAAIVVARRARPARFPTRTARRRCVISPPVCRTPWRRRHHHRV